MNVPQVGDLLWAKGIFGLRSVAIARVTPHRFYVERRDEAFNYREALPRKEWNKTYFSTKDEALQRFAEKQLYLATRFEEAAEEARVKAAEALAQMED